MNTQTENKIGYWFYPPDSHHAPGGNGLDIIIKEIPTDQHFDPFLINLPIKSRGGIETLKIHHPWSYGKTYRVCAGLVEMIDRNGIKEEAFSFGGNLTIHSKDEYTLIILASPAPIIDINAADQTKMLFVEEVEILLAERRAALLANKNAYESHLADINPLSLYVTCVYTLVKKYEHMVHKEDPEIMGFLNFVHAEFKRLKEEELAPLLIPSIEDIL